MVSIIVPAYNAVWWLPAAVRSVLAQTEQDWELVLVDDGSTDATPGLCDGYAASDPRIRVEHTPNAGVSAARNRGLRLCGANGFCFSTRMTFCTPTCSVSCSMPSHGIKWIW